MQAIRYLDKLIDELAKGKTLKTIFRLSFHSIAYGTQTDHPPLLQNQVAGINSKTNVLSLFFI